MTSASIQENQQYPWNWFRTLTERESSVKSESRETNIFSNFLPRAGSASLLTVDVTSAVLVC